MKKARMNRSFWNRSLGAACLTGMLLASLAAQAQYTGSNQTNTIDGVASNWTAYSGVYMIGGQAGASNYAGDVLIIQNGGTLTNASTAFVGYNGNNNQAIINGTGSKWNIGGNLDFGQVNNAWSEVVVVTNGGALNVGGGTSVGWWGASQHTPATAHRLMVTGSNSLWTSTGGLAVGNGGGQFNRVDILNGGVGLLRAASILGNYVQCASNTLSVSGTGSLLQINGSLTVGNNTGANAPYGNQFLISTGGVSIIGGNLIVGLATGQGGQLVQIDKGTLYVTSNVSSTPAILVVGSNSMVVLNSGSITADRLTLTNGPLAGMQFNGGSLTTSGTMVSNGSAFVAGNGVSASTFSITGGTNTFFNGLTIAANTALAVGGTNAIGSATIKGDLTLQANAVLDLDFNQTTNDWLQVNGTVNLPAMASLRARALEATVRSPIRVLQATSIAGDPSGWSQVRVNNLNYRAVVSGNQLTLVKAPSCTAIMFR